MHETAPFAFFCKLSLFFLVDMRYHRNKQKEGLGFRDV